MIIYSIQVEQSKSCSNNKTKNILFEIKRLRRNEIGDRT